jgi:hypothetical protein
MTEMAIFRSEITANNENKTKTKGENGDFPLRNKSKQQWRLITMASLPRQNLA